ncbi:hypothetical protein NLU13_6691 [Sarocladium strictum]|uniref:N-acetyltransferase domain-containing protein n=1 Tax=Sarocladium strictum TaxID=5046 RepID=A0AA39GEE7_SARSR|nr:hypothetical protein NLU13_6691 [Sarocladium strictum]
MAFWRPMLAADLPAVDQLSNEIHPELPESPEVFAERLSLFPAGCFVVEDAGTIRGYIISHPIVKHEPPALDKNLGTIDPKADTYYIHDLVVSSQLRGRGLAGDGVQRVLETAAREGFSEICLISVYGTAGFWGRHGFEKQAIEGSLAKKLEGYGSDAVFMTRLSGS